MNRFDTSDMKVPTVKWLFRCTIIWERIIVTIWANPSQARDSVSDGPQFPLMCAAGMRRNGIWEVAQGYFGLRREGPARA